MLYSMEWKTALFLSLLTGIYLTWAENETNESLNDVDHDDRVFNGTPVNPPHSLPYVAQLKVNDDRIYGGVIYDKWTIITSASAVYWPKKIFVGKYFRIKNEPSQQEREICMRSQHPNSTSSNYPIYAYDYGIIHLSDPLIFNEFVQPGKFPKFGDDFPTQNCKIAGWGRVSEGTGEGGPQSEELRETSVTILSPKDCQHQHYTIQCISKAACHYDTGNSVTCGGSSQDVVIGSISSNYPNCRPTQVSVLSLLPEDWFNQQIEEATKKCRGTPPPPPPTTPPPNDCCNIGDTLNGDPAVPHSRPFIVQIHKEGSQQVAIGVLINAYTVITSAHQVDNVRKISAGKHLFGKYEGTQQTRVHCSISKHPNIGKPEKAFDYGLIHLADPFVFNEYVNAINLAPAGDKPKEECSIIAWQQNYSETVLREQKVTFKDPSTCKNVHETITCVEGGACLHDWGSPVICSHDSKIFFHAIVSSANAYCKDAILSSIAELPRSWLATELRNAETKCGKSVR